MSSTDIRVQVGPANYFSHTAAIERLGDFFSAEKLEQAITHVETLVVGILGSASDNYL